MDFTSPTSPEVPRHREDHSHAAHVSVWFVATSRPADALTQPLRGGRGFARKYLAALNPTWPVTPIGDFPLNRSAPASRHEFYIASYPGLAMVHTAIDDATDTANILDTVATLRRPLPADWVCAIAKNPEDGSATFARFDGNQLVRLFTATNYKVLVDDGMPESFEQPYWAGAHANPLIGALGLPFRPADLAQAAETAWLGFDTGPGGPAVDVTAFATDGRPEPTIAPPPPPRALDDLLRPKTSHRADTAESTAPPTGHTLGGTHEDTLGEYDDYETTPAAGNDGQLNDIADNMGRMLEDVTGAMERHSRIISRALTRRITRR